MIINPFAFGESNCIHNTSKNGGIILGVEAEQIQYCENCKEDTLHKTYEDAMEIIYRCTQCEEESEVFKSFF
jgi:hypothetical protein